MPAGQAAENTGAPQATGQIEEIIYRNPSNDYTVLALIDDASGILVTAVGTLPYVAEGETVRLWGNWTRHPEYGRQLCVSHYEKDLPRGEQDILRYLSSRAIRGVGPATAAKIVERFGADTLEVIEQHPEWLADIPGITRKKAAAIYESFREQAGYREIMALCGSGVGAAAVARIAALWGNDAAGIIRSTPYRLCSEIDGIGFDTADEIAARMGIGADAPIRIASGLAYVLQYNASVNGHTCLPRTKLVAAAAEKLGLTCDAVDGAIPDAVRNGFLAVHTVDGTEMVYTAEYDRMEAECAEMALSVAQGAVTFGREDLVRLIDRMEEEWQIRYADKQREAIGVALSGGMMILTGGPGTGKTTVIRALIRMFDRLDLKTALVAPTGRAAKRMSEATVHEARTIHRMLEMERNAANVPRFRRNEEYPLDELAVIVDECSMIDLPLFRALLGALRRGSHLILVGDSDQLPSVGCGNVLGDLIASGVFPTVRLDEIFRQSDAGLIVSNAHRINQGEMPVLTEKRGDFFFLARRNDTAVADTVVSLLTERLPRAYGEDITGQIQVVAPSRKGICGTEQLNRRLQAALNPSAAGRGEVAFRDVIFRAGDRVMQIRNHYDLEWTRGEQVGSGVFNGDMGIILSVDPGEKTMRVSFDDRVVVYDAALMEEVEHAYAITVHKSQGSEYPVVIFPAASCPPMLRTRNLLYTALTRARRMVIVVGRQDCIAQMVANDRHDLRYTTLAQRLRRVSAGTGGGLENF